MTEEFRPGEWITTQEAARLTGYSVQYIRRLINRQRIAARKWGRDWFVNKEALLDYQRTMEQLGRARYDPWRSGRRQRKSGAG